MPKFTPEQITKALQSAGFKRGATDQDVANAGKYGLGIFKASASRLAAPKGSTAPVTVSPEDQAVQGAQSAYDTSGTSYKNNLLASGVIRDVLAKTAAEADPSVSQVRTARNAAQAKLGTLFTDTFDELKDITDPRMREQIRASRSTGLAQETDNLSGQLSDMGESRNALIEKVAGIHAASTEAGKFDVGQKENALARALGIKQKATERNQQIEDRSAQQAFDSRMDELTRREKEASIAATNRSNRGGGGGLTALQLLGLQDTNPLGLAQMKGYTRQLAPDGGKGFWFYNKEGNPVPVEEVANAIGGNKAALLAGSSNEADQAIIQTSSGKLPSAAQQQRQVNAASGTQSLSQLQTLLDKGIPQSQLSLAKFGPTSLFAGKDAKAYRDAARNIADMVARIRTGAQINEKEMDLYLQFVPGPSDPPYVRQQKIETLKTIFGGANVPGVDQQTTDTGV